MALVLVTGATGQVARGVLPFLEKALMGPRSDNRGYGEDDGFNDLRFDVLQWVHGRITVVMPGGPGRPALLRKLQWVHGRITVVLPKLSTAAASRRTPHIQNIQSGIGPPHSKN
jgi:hypothetical protein